MKNITIFLALLFLVACEESLNRPLATVDTNLVVVEGMVTSENTSHLISLSHPYQSQNETPEPISGASIQITESTNTYQLTESPAGSGKYYTPIMRAITGKTYKLTIQYQNKIYTAADSPVPVEPLQPIQYYKVNDLYSIELSDYGQDPNFVDYNVSWTNAPACTSSNCEIETAYYDLKNVDVNEIFKPKKEDLLFPLNSKIIRTKYSVSPAYRAFLRSMLSETEWRGGVFDIQRANVGSNMSDGAVGFFAATTIVSDTTVVTE